MRASVPRHAGRPFDVPRPVIAEPSSDALDGAGHAAVAPRQSVDNRSNSTGFVPRVPSGRRSGEGPKLIAWQRRAALTSNRISSADRGRGPIGNRPSIRTGAADHYLAL